MRISLVVYEFSRGEKSRGGGLKFLGECRGE